MLSVSFIRHMLFMQTVRGFQPAKDLDIPLNGYVYCYPAKSNYLGGDIISGMIETELYKKDGISVSLIIGPTVNL